MEDLVAVKLVRIAELVQRLATRTFTPRFGLRNTDLRILNLLQGSSGMPVSELGRRAHVDKGWISRSLAHLLSEGLVARGAHPTDTRLTLVSLTEKGRALVAEVAPIARANEARLLAGVDGEVLKQALKQLQANAERLYEAAPASD